MELGRLLEALRGDPMARLRHAVLKKAGIPPFSLRAAFIGRKQILRYACHLALDAEESGELGAGSFDMGRFLEMKEGEHGGI